MRHMAASNGVIAMHGDTSYVVAMPLHFSVLPGSGAAIFARNPDIAMAICFFFASKIQEFCTPT